MSAEVITFGLFDNDSPPAFIRAFPLPFSKLDATAAPAVGDDDADGFVAGSLWADRTAHKIYVCQNNATGAAVWAEIPGAGGGSVDDTAYNATSWNAVTTVAPSKNAMRDWIETLGSAAYVSTSTFDAAGSAAAAYLAGAADLAAHVAAADPHPQYLTAAEGDAAYEPIGGGGGVSDGDKGDIIVSGTGTVWTIEDAAVTLAKQADMATASLVYRKTAGAGPPEINTLATLKTDLGLTGTNGGDQTITLTGHVTGSGTGSFATTIAAGVVTLAMQANMATASVVYRKTAGSGAPEVNTLATLKTDLVLVKGDVGLGNVDNTSDVAKPVSTAQQAAIDAAVVGLWDFKGVTDCSANPNYPAALKGDTYVVSVAGKIGGASGVVVNVGDIILATADNAGGTQASVGTSWSVLEANIPGITTAGNSFITLANPSAITFPRINADNSVTALSAAAFLSAIGGGTGSGTVTAVSIVTANGVSGSSSGGATPALTIVLGAITPTSVSTGGVTCTTLAVANTVANTSTPFDIAHIDGLSSGTPAAGFGTNTLWYLQSDTTVGRQASKIVVTWATATDASRKARIVHNVYDTAAREALRMEASGTAPMIGFLGASAVVQQTGNIGAALVALGLMSGTPTFAYANLTGAPSGTGTVTNAGNLTDEGMVFGDGGTVGVKTRAMRAGDVVAALNPGLLNCTLACSVGSSALTIALKTYAGTDPTAADPIRAMFRSPTAATGTWVERTVTAANSLVISSGSTMGFASATAGRLWVVLFDDGGTMRLAAIKCVGPGSGTNVYPLREDILASATSEGGAGAADAPQVFYAGATITTKAYKIIGYLDWASGLTTAGTWAIVPTTIQLFGPGVKLPGEVIQETCATLNTVASGTTLLPADDTPPQSNEGDQFLTCAVTPVATPNILRVVVNTLLSHTIAGALFGAALFQDSAASAIKSSVGLPLVANAAITIVLIHQQFAGTVSSTTFKLRGGAHTAGTTTMNGITSTRYYGGTQETRILIQELQG